MSTPTPERVVKLAKPGEVKGYGGPVPSEAYDQGAKLAMEHPREAVVVHEFTFTNDNRADVLRFAQREARNESERLNRDLNPEQYHVGTSTTDEKPALGAEGLTGGTVRTFVAHWPDGRPRRTRRTKTGTHGAEVPVPVIGTPDPDEPDRRVRVGRLVDGKVTYLDENDEWGPAATAQLFYADKAKQMAAGFNAEHDGQFVAEDVDEDAFTAANVGVDARSTAEVADDLANAGLDGGTSVPTEAEVTAAKEAAEDEGEPF